MKAFRLVDTKTNTVAMRIDAYDIAGAKRTVIKLGAVGILDSWLDTITCSVTGRYLLEEDEDE